MTVGDRTGTRLWPAVIALALLVLPSSAPAFLGGNTASVQADQLQMNGTLRTGSAGQYTQYDIEMPSGTVVREYVSPAGMVFAVTWDGPSQPNLRQVLGNYFVQYIDGARTRGPRANPRVIQQPGLVLHTGGHMRAFFGKAYIPQLVPPGVNPDDLN